MSEESLKCNSTVLPKHTSISNFKINNNNNNNFISLKINYDEENKDKNVDVYFKKISNNKWKINFRHFINDFNTIIIYDETKSFEENNKINKIIDIIN